MDAEGRDLPHFLALSEWSQARSLQTPRALCPHLAQAPDLHIGAGRRPSGPCKVDHSILWDPAVPQWLKHRLSQNGLFLAAGMVRKPEQEEGKAGGGFCRVRVRAAHSLCLCVTSGEPPNFSEAQLPKL